MRMKTCPEAAENAGEPTSSCESALNLDCSRLGAAHATCIDREVDRVMRHAAIAARESDDGADTEWRIRAAAVAWLRGFVYAATTRLGVGAAMALLPAVLARLRGRPAGRKSHGTAKSRTTALLVESMRFGVATGSFSCCYGLLKTAATVFGRRYVESWYIRRRLQPFRGELVRSAREQRCGDETGGLRLHRERTGLVELSDVDAGPRDRSGDLEDFEEEEVEDFVRIGMRSTRDVSGGVGRKLTLRTWLSDQAQTVDAAGADFAPDGGHFDGNTAKDTPGCDEIDNDACSFDRDDERTSSSSLESAPSQASSACEPPSFVSVPLPPTHSSQRRRNDSSSASIVAAVARARSEYYERERLMSNFIAGSVSGLSVLFTTREWRQSVVLYLFVRTLHCLYNKAMIKEDRQGFGRNSFVSSLLVRISNNNFMQPVLFAFGCAQVMYSYVMRPSTLPPSYFSFISKTGPISDTILQLVRAANRAKSPPRSDKYGKSVPGLSSVVDAQELMDYMRHHNIDITTLVSDGARKTNAAAGDTGLVRLFIESLTRSAARGGGHHDSSCGAKAVRPRAMGTINNRNHNHYGVPCRLLHPQSPTCSGNSLRVFWKAFRQSLPFYVSIYAVPSVLFHSKRLVREPYVWLETTAINSVRSTTFLSAFVAIYMGVVCSHRNLRLPEHRSLYWIAGVFASSSIVLEKASRRTELTMYVLPRALDSLLLLLLDRRLVPEVPFLEVFVMCFCTGMLMTTIEEVPEAVPPLFRGAITRVVLGGAEPVMSGERRPHSEAVKRR